MRRFFIVIIVKESTFLKSSIDLKGSEFGFKRCTVCEFGGTQLPCTPVKSVYAGHVVNECAMTCAHQSIISKVRSLLFTVPLL